MKTHIVGIGVVPPTIQDMIVFEEAIMADEMESKNTIQNDLALDSKYPFAQGIAALGTLLKFWR